MDILAVSKLEHEAGARVVVDNVFATPLKQRPLENGADIVIYSTTKHIDGQRRLIGGAVLSFRLHSNTEAFRLLDNLFLIDNSSNLGDSKSLATHRYTTTHSSLSEDDFATIGITNADLRLAVALKAADDLIKDLQPALAVLG